MRWTMQAFAAMGLMVWGLPSVLAADVPRAADGPTPATSPAVKRAANIWLDKQFPALKVSKWLSRKPDRKGKVTILAFWRSDSPGCGFNFIAGLSGDQLQWRDDLVVIAVNSEPADVQQAFFDKVKNHPNYYVAIDDGAACAALNPPSLPYVLILDSDGVVRWQADADFLEKAARGDPAAPTPLIIRQIIRADNGVARRREHFELDAGEVAHPAAAAHPLTPPERVLHAKPMVGKPFPELKVGQWLTPEPDRKGKVLLIDFWGTSCGACIRNMPELNQLQAKFKDDLVIIGMNPEPVEDQRKFMTQHKMAYSVAAGEDIAAIAQTLEVEAIPNVFILDSGGIVRWQGIPMDEADPLTADLVRRIIDADSGVAARHK